MFVFSIYVIYLNNITLFILKLQSVRQPKMSHHLSQRLTNVKLSGLQLFTSTTCFIHDTC